jgi:hypothetical protein
MPYNFSGNQVQYTAKNGVVSDGELISVGTGTVYSGTASGTNVLSYTGTQAVSVLSERTAFAANPVHGATGFWSMQLKDSARKVLDVAVVPISTGVPSALSPLLVQVQPTTQASPGGQLVLNWVFLNTSALPTEVPVAGQFLVYVVYSEGS